jgi:hypothetical protein
MPLGIDNGIRGAALDVRRAAAVFRIAWTELKGDLIGSNRRQNGSMTRVTVGAAATVRVSPRV